MYSYVMFQISNKSEHEADAADRVVPCHVHSKAINLLALLCNDMLLCAFQCSDMLLCTLQ